MSSRVIMSLSGGLDSATLLAEIRTSHEGEDVQTVSFNYGSKHNKWEIPKAKELAAYYGVQHTIIDMQGVLGEFKSNLLQSGGDIPEGHYNDENMKLTVVPCRNLIFISVLAGLAESLDFNTLAIGVHQGDHHIYPDCRLDFINAIEVAVIEATDGKVKRIVTPFIGMDKASIVTKGLILKVPYGRTRTCYKDQPVACGKCGSCRERLEAFTFNKVEDPLPYEGGR